MGTDKDTIDFRKYIAEIKRKKWLYVLSLVVFMGLAVTYHFYHMDLFEAQSEMLIGDRGFDSSGPASAPSGSSITGLMSMVRQFDVYATSGNSVRDEELILNSHNLIIKTVKRLGLNYTYLERDGMKKVNLYKKTPIVLAASKAVTDTLSTTLKFKVNMYADGKVDIKMVKGFFSHVVAQKTGMTLPCSFNTPYGDFQVLKTPLYSPKQERVITVLVSSNDDAAEGFRNVFSASAVTKLSNNVALSVSTANFELCKDFLNGLVAEYNNLRLDRKNSQIQNDLDFYDKMLAEINTVLKKSEDKMQDYQQKNNIVSPEEESLYFFQADKASEQQLASLQDRMRFYDLVLSIINDPNKRFSLLPVSGNESTDVTINAYNELILQRQNIQHSASEDNVTLSLISSKIDAMRSLVGENINLLKKNTSMVISTAQGISSQNRAQLDRTPLYQREIINLTRDKELYNSLYVFLLQRRYNAAMALHNTSSNAFVYDPAHGKNKPLLKKSMMGLGVCLFLGLAIPTAIAIICVLRRKDESQEEKEKEQVQE